MVTVPTINGYLSRSELTVLGEFARDIGPGAALEIGHYEGLSTATIATNLPAGSVFCGYSVQCS